MKSPKQMLIMVVTLIIGMFFISNSAMSQQMKLVSVKTKSPIVLDAFQEKAWSKAKALKVVLDETPYKPSNGYDGMKETTVSIKSSYNKSSIYFYIQWDDPTKSLARFPWIKQANGSWKQSMAKDSTGHDNSFYEDKLGIYWEIKAQGFKKKGCDVSCHIAEDGKVDGIKDTSAGRKYTKLAGETIDMWHWKGVRTNPLGLFDDQFVDSTKDPKKNKNWGRKGDDKIGGGYKNNINKAKTGPVFMNSGGSEEYKYMVVPWLRTKFVDNFKTGDVVPGIVLSAFTGHRADIKVKGAWKDGKWTLEVKRSLKTRGKNAKIQDVQFSDLKKPYYFGLSVFDNSQINHIYHNGSIELRFN